jgi:hypothetical protein
MCQIPEIFDSRSEVLLCLTAGTAGHFHPNRQAKLTHCAGGMAAMRTEPPVSQVISVANHVTGGVALATKTCDTKIFDFPVSAICCRL